VYVCRVGQESGVTDRLTDKPLLIWLTTPPHLKYVATLPCNLSLMACFADVNISQGSLATYARCGGIFNIRLTTNFPRSLPVKIFFPNRLRFDRMVVVSLWPHFLVHPLGNNGSENISCRLTTFRAASVFIYSVCSSLAASYYNTGCSQTLIVLFT